MAKKIDLSKLNSTHARLLIIPLCVLALGIGLFLHNNKNHSFASGGDAYFTISPTSGSYTVGNNIVVSISEYSQASDNVNAVQANLSYPTSTLEYKSISLTGPFSLCGQQTGGGGSVNIGCASTSVVSGTQAVAQVTFTVLSSGTAAINMSGGSDIDNNSGSSVWNGALPTSNFSLTGGSQNSGSGGSSGSSGSGSSSKSSTKSGSTSATKPVTTPVTTPVHTTTTQNTTPPKTTITTTTTNASTPKTGTVVITVDNSAGQPLSGAKVVLDSKYSETTNGKGQASFTGIASGLYSVDITSANYKEVQANVTLSPDQTKLASYKLASASHTMKALLYSGSFLVVVLAGAFFWYFKFGIKT